MAETVAEAPVREPMAELVKSIEVKQAGANVTIAAKAPGEGSGACSRP